MAKFKSYGLRLHTEYATEGSWKFKVEHTNPRPCFHETFDAVNELEADNKEIDITYHIFLYKGYELVTCDATNWNNACPFDRNFIANHIRQLNLIFPVEFSIDEYFNKWVVNLHIRHKSSTFHKYAMCWVRYLYEFPFNMMTMDVYRLQNEPQFYNINIHSLYAFLFASIPNKMKHPHGQQIMKDCLVKILSLDELRKRIPKYTYRSNSPLNSVFPDISAKIPELTFSDSKVFDSEYWESDELFKKERLGIYTQLIDKLK